MPQHSRWLITIICSCFFLVTASAQAPEFDVTPLGNGRLFDAAWDLHYGPDDYLWVTERELGMVVRFHPETAARDELIRIQDVYADARQDGLLGMALHPRILEDSNYVYLSYTYLQAGERRQRIVRYTYEQTMDGSDGMLSSPLTLLENLPASNDHNSGRLIYGPDDKLYYTIGDQGGNQGRNYCNPILSQILPTQEEIDQADWSNYPGKILRLNPDGSIPDDNPELSGVRSHIYTYGHRNAQGIVFSPDEKLYSDEHGPDTDDEVNLILPGKNYGWPRVVGFRDDQAYDYCDWSSLANCPDLEYDKFNCPGGATFLEENTLTDTNYQEPLFSLFAVTDDYDYNNPACSDTWVCRPNVAPSSLEIYTSDAIPEWTNSLLVISLKRGRIYRLQLDENGTAISGDTTRHFYTRNRLRDLVAAPDGKTFYAITDVGGRMTTFNGLSSFRDFDNPGTILKFSLRPPVSTGDPGQSSALKVWPNPSTGTLFVEHQANTPAKATLQNANGQRLQSFTLRSGSNELALGAHPPGVYFLSIRTGNQHAVKRVILR